MKNQRIRPLEQILLRTPNILQIETWKAHSMKKHLQGDPTRTTDEQHTSRATENKFNCKLTEPQAGDVTTFPFAAVFVFTQAPVFTQ